MSVTVSKSPINNRMRDFNFKYSYIHQNIGFFRSKIIIIYKKNGCSFL